VRDAAFATTRIAKIHSLSHRKEYEMGGANGAKESTLGVNVFTAPGKPMAGERPKPLGEAFGFDPMTSTLIFGDYDAVLVDAMTTVAEAEALAGGLLCTTATWRPST
jgi:hypothetical protein